MRVVFYTGRKKSVVQNLKKGTLARDIHKKGTNISV